jgi:hypothetical protein
VIPAEQPEAKPAEESAEEPEDDEFEDEDFDEGEDMVDLDDDAGEMVRMVKVHSSQKPKMREGDPIYLTSELIGFDGVEVFYQWQVDRGDGLGWVDVKGATGSTHTFIATRETIQYSWRLIVTTNE